MDSLQELSITAGKWRKWDIIGLDGKFVVRSFPAIRKLFDEIECGKNPKVAIDMTRVVQIDSSTLTVIMNFQRRLVKKNGRIVLIGPNADIKETLLLVGFDMVVPLYDSREAFEREIREKTFQLHSSRGRPPDAS